MNSNVPNRLIQLTDAFLDDNLDFGQNEELQDLLRANEHNRLYFICKTHLDANLRIAVCGELDSQKCPSQSALGNSAATARRRGALRWLAPLAAAASLVLAATLWIKSYRPGQSTEEQSSLTVVEAAGEVFVGRHDTSDTSTAVSEKYNRHLPAPGTRLRFNETIETGADGTVDLAYADGTRITLQAESMLRYSAPAAGAGKVGKLLLLERGALNAVVSVQPQKSPLVVVTPHAEATVLGTELNLLVTAQATRLDVKKGLVRLKRQSDGRVENVAAGQFAAVADDVEFKAKTSSGHRLSSRFNGLIYEKYADAYQQGERILDTHFQSEGERLATFGPKQLRNAIVQSEELRVKLNSSSGEGDGHLEVKGPLGPFKCSFRLTPIDMTTAGYSITTEQKVKFSRRTLTARGSRAYGFFVRPKQESVDRQLLPTLPESHFSNTGGWNLPDARNVWETHNTRILQVGEDLDGTPICEILIVNADKGLPIYNDLILLPPPLTFGYELEGLDLMLRSIEVRTLDSENTEENIP